MAKHFTTTDAASHIAQFNAAQPIATVQTLSLDERIDQVKAAVIAAKAQDNQAEVERLRGVWASITAEIEAAEAAPAAASLPFEPTTADLDEMYSAAVADVLDELTAAADQVRAEAAHEWTNALDFGWSWLLTQDAFTVDAHGSLLVPSSRNPETVYRSNGVCQCEAFTKSSTPRPCYHRAAGHIVERWRENTTIDQLAERWA